MHIRLDFSRSPTPQLLLEPRFSGLDFTDSLKVLDVPTITFVFEPPKKRLEGRTLGRQILALQMVAPPVAEIADGNLAVSKDHYSVFQGERFHPRAPMP